MSNAHTMTRQQIDAMRNSKTNGQYVAQSHTTPTVHRAKVVSTKNAEGAKTYHLVQLCGMGRRQLAYLAPVEPGTAVTCKRCAALDA